MDFLREVFRNQFVTSFIDSGTLLPRASCDKPAIKYGKGHGMKYVVELLIKWAVDKDII
jgi:hypothetical protein